MTKSKQAMLAAIAMTMAVPGVASAKGCIKGAIAGAVAGHYAGHHAIAGAAAGCAAGHAIAKHKAQAAKTAPAAH